MFCLVRTQATSAATTERQLLGLYAKADRAGFIAKTAGAWFNGVDKALNCRFTAQVVL
ncbi:MAG: hypothetical protein LCH73_02085 [Proteobacteria bacterium]|nr:hypothetical protein [Pseudomonadota bacterium]